MATTYDRTGALDGLRVLDFSRVLAGPLATMILGDLGADVIKIERPGAGDDTRHWGPPFVGDDAAYFLSLNRNKRSVALDLATEQGQLAARTLAGRADVLVENFRPGLMAGFGLDHATLAAANSRLVYCSITAFTDPADTRPGYDIIMQALSGLLSVTGTRDGEPAKVGVALLDVITGLYAAIGIQAALAARDRTGQGQFLSVSLYDTAVASLANQAANYLMGGVVPGPLGTEHPNIVPYQAFAAADRSFILAAGNDRFFARTCEVVGRPELASDPAFATNADRVRNRERLIPQLAGALRARTASEWLAALEAAGVPCAPIRTLDEVFAAPESAGLVEHVPDPVRGALRLVAAPIRLSQTPAATRRPPPLLGEHTAGVDDLWPDRPANAPPT
jgi:crotonobetainyl-CoA:carnitine CoA-transferase CaiB-like acyl-CoA transferase